MTTRGPVWEGGPSDPPTAPFPPGYGPYGDGPYRNPTYPNDSYRQSPDQADPYEGLRYQSSRPRPRRRRFRWLRRIIVVLASLILLCALAFGGLLLVTPSVANAPALARAQAQAHHAVYPGPPVPIRFSESLIATEDHRFYSEPGIDPLAVARVLGARVTGRGDQGGATLYQQLAKLLYTQGRSGLTVEAEQVGLAVKLDFTYSKPKILQMYADVAYFGHGYYGLPMASCGYFGTTPAGLSLPQAALLAGLVQQPSADDPILHYAKGRAREQHVLDRLVAVGKITQAYANSAFSQRLNLVGGKGTGCPGPR